VWASGTAKLSLLFRAAGEPAKPNHRERDMRLSPARVEQALSQFEAQVLPEDHPSMAKIKGLWGDHTYFLAPNGLNIVEPVESDDSGTEVAAVVNLATWTDDSATSLSPHAPQATEVLVEFDDKGDQPEEPGMKPNRRH
jgi:hypothetical protein